MQEPQQITDLLVAWNEGDNTAVARLMLVVEQELRRIAHRHMWRENRGHTLQTTALVNEAYLKLVDQERVTWQNRSHFFAISAQIMRRILLNHARERAAEKRGGNADRIDLDDVFLISEEKSAELVALDEALQKLAAVDELKSRIVEMRFFGGLTIEETAEVLQIAPPTVSVHWRFARAWLRKEMIL